jgi:hypothetical protein
LISVYLFVAKKINAAIFTTAEMEALGATASLIAILQLSFEVADYVRNASGASKERKELLKELRSCEQTLKSLLDEADDCEEGEAWSETVKTLEAPDAPLGVLNTALTTVKAKLQPKAGFANKIKGALAWPFQQKEVDKIIDVINRQKQLLLIALANDSRKLGHAIKKTSEETAVRLAELSVYLKDTSQGLTSLQNDMCHLRLGEDTRNMQQERQGILNWLTTTDYASQHNDFIARRQEGTGKWLLESSEFHRWKATKGQTLFCPGIPGAGKTITTSIVVDHLESSCDSETGVAYVYCNFRRLDDQRPYQLLASLLRKLSRDKWDSARPILKTLYDRHKDKASRASLEDISGALRCVAAAYSRVFIVIDAVDECQAPDGRLTRFLTEIFTLQDSCGANILATSRPIPDIRRRFEKSTELEIRAAPEDIEQYIDGHISQLARCVSTDPRLQLEIKAAIVESVQGMYVIHPLLHGLNDRAYSVQGSSLPNFILTR